MSSKLDLALKRAIKKENCNKEHEEAKPLPKGTKVDQTHGVKSKERTLKIKKFRARKEQNTYVD